MAHLQYMPGDPRLVDLLVCELKSKGIFDQFRKECIADVDTRPAYQNLRQRVESSVASFLSRQVWKPDLNKNQLREKLRKHLLDGNYLEQGVERIVDQVVNPKVATVFIPQVEDLVYNYLGIPRKKATATTTGGPETSNGKLDDLLPTDLEAVSPGSVTNDNDDKMDTSDSKEEKMDIDEPKTEVKEDSVITIDSVEKENTRLSGLSELTIHDSDTIDKNTTTIPLPEEIKLENIPPPENSPPKINSKNIDLEKINLPKELNLSTDIPLPDEIPKAETEYFFKPIPLASDDDSSGSSLRRNMSPLTPIRNFNNENSCDAQQAFENDSDSKTEGMTEPRSFRFTIEAKSSENSSEPNKVESKEDPVTYQYNTQTNMNTFNTPMYDDSSNSNNLQIDYESDANSKATDIKVPEVDQNSVDTKKDKRDDKKSISHKSSHRSKDSHRHSSSKDRRSESKQSSPRDSTRHEKDKKSLSSKDSSSKDDKNKEKSSSKDKSLETSEKKDIRESSKHRSSSHKSSRDKDSKHRSERTSSSTSSSKHSSKDDKKSTSSTRDKEKSEKPSERSKDSKERSKDHKSSSSSRDKDRKSSNGTKKSDEKENKEKRDKKQSDDHYSLSGRGNPNRRSTDRDSNDGSSSSKGFHNPANPKTTESKKSGKNSSKSGTTSSSDSTSPSDSVEIIEAKSIPQNKPVVHVDTHLEAPVAAPARLPFVPNVTIKKPKIAANFEEAKRLMKMRKFLEEEQKRMNQEAALLLEFQANVRPSLSQVFSNNSGPELEFVCNNTSQTNVVLEKPTLSKNITETDIETDTVVNDVQSAQIEDRQDDIDKTMIAMYDDGQNIPEDYSHLEYHQDHTNASVLEDLSDQKEVMKEEITIIIETCEEAPECNLDLLQEKIQVSDINDEEVIENDIVCEIAVENYSHIDSIALLHERHFQNELETEISNVKTDEIEKVEDSVNNNIDESVKVIETADLSVENILPTKEINDNSLKFFSEQEMFDSELERDNFSKFMKKYMESLTTKLYLINCDTYEENIVREVAEAIGKYEIVNYFKNGHISKANKSVVKDINVCNEIILPTQVEEKERSFTPINEKRAEMFSPSVKSECSFDLSSEYNAAIEDMVNKTSRQEIMEIILGGEMDSCPSEMPTIDYCTESNIEDNNFNTYVTEVYHAEQNMEKNNLKRKANQVETIESTNNNGPVLTPNKLRKLSISDQISSTTEESEEPPSTKTSTPVASIKPKSKFLGRAKRVGLSKPKKSVNNIQNSPSSDKSVENYETNSNKTPNGKIKATLRSKVQRYDTSDLYKPKLHYLSRRNHIT